jgi:hypothetical protein
VALRCRIVLAAAAGLTNVAIGVDLGVDVKTVALWRGRFAQTGPEGLWAIASGRGRKPTYSPQKIKAIVQATLSSKPKGMTQWSCRLMAHAQGVSKSTVSTIWRSHNLKPHRVKRFKLSRDARFLEKLTDVVGLYLNPPDQALVLCVDEKTQIQALDRTQPGLPLKKGRLGTMTHDDKRNGTTCLFAALEILQGKVIGQCYARHRHQEFLKFLRRLDAAFPGEVALHVVMDNYGTHKHPHVQMWLTRHPDLSRTLSPPVPVGSTWWNAGSANSPPKPYDAAPLAAWRPLRSPSPNSSTRGTKTPSPSSGPPLSNPFKPNSPGAVRPWSRSHLAVPHRAAEHGKPNLQLFLGHYTSWAIFDVPCLPKKIA